MKPFAAEDWPLNQRGTKHATLRGAFDTECLFTVMHILTFGAASQMLGFTNPNTQQFP